MNVSVSHLIFSVLHEGAEAWLIHLGNALMIALMMLNICFIFMLPSCCKANTFSYLSSCSSFFLLLSMAVILVPSPLPLFFSFLT